MYRSRAADVYYCTFRISSEFHLGGTQDFKSEKTKEDVFDFKGYKIARINAA